jgi:class 3 adenylate cyclase
MTSGQASTFSGHAATRPSVTFLFTDIEGSTGLVKALQEDYTVAHLGELKRVVFRVTSREIEIVAL